MCFIVHLLDVTFVRFVYVLEAFLYNFVTAYAECYMQVLKSTVHLNNGCYELCVSAFVAC